ncbi:YdhR family protein [Chitinophaga sp. HK235]|uniref:YdhR family protein n=1 Tax=Chitinophaga sp. HK235 TaxID=2952571 RepID=UPI001BAB65FC|nr:YdhR family protein [Chitinophaga sp. HK235]
MSTTPGKVFLYGEFQTSVPAFTKALWEPVNEQLQNVKGLIRKTWLLGIGTNTVGGFYEFDSIEHAREFATGLYAEQARYVNASLTVKIFDGDITEEASRAMKSPHYD